uniref:Importin-11 n=1 Tax=Rhabditophanes sp. KR3021 TaxID=114890 RepID=A0AC35TMN4_9BILA
MMNIIPAVARLISDPKNDTQMAAQLRLLLDMICETSELEMNPHFSPFMSHVLCGFTHINSIYHLDLLGKCQSQAVVGTKELLKSNSVLMNIIPAVARLIPDPKNDTHMTAQLRLLLDMDCIY